MLAHMLKALQVVLLAACTDWGAVTALSLWQWALIVAFIVSGQFLNLRVYDLLGEAGVYYGARFGVHIPWVTAWPYSHIRDPQYVGAILTLLGLSFIIPWEVRLIRVDFRPFLALYVSSTFF